MMFTDRSFLPFHRVKAEFSALDAGVYKPLPQPLVDTPDSTYKLVLKMV